MVVPLELGPTVRIYVCGITPYDSTHLGHAATYLAYDILIRRIAVSYTHLTLPTKA